MLVLDRFYGGIIGALVAAVAGALVSCYLLPSPGVPTDNPPGMTTARWPLRDRSSPYLEPTYTALAASASRLADGSSCRSPELTEAYSKTSPGQPFGGCCG